MKELRVKIRKLDEKLKKGLTLKDLEIKNRMSDGLVQKERSLGMIKKRSYALEQAMTRDILNNADVVRFMNSPLNFI